MTQARQLRPTPGTAVENVEARSVASEANTRCDIGTNNVADAREGSSARVPPPWGGPLSETDYALLESSWITRELADAAMLRRLDTYDGRDVVGHKGKRDCAGMLIPSYWPGELRPFNYRLRLDNPEWKFGRDGKPKPDRKYMGPLGSSNRLYVPPGVTLEQLQDIAIPIAIVEGEKKALALSRLAHYESEKSRWIPIAIAGVWNWLGTVGKAGGPKGERVDVKGPISDLSRIAWMGRTVFIVFDANVHTNDSVNWARKGIARELATRGAAVHFIDLPKDCGMNGIDDLLAAWGPARVLELFKEPTPGRQLEVVSPPQFQSRPEGMFRVTTKGEQALSQVQLSNYRASIITNVRLDNGVETRSEFEIESELIGQPFRFMLPASEFAKMDWAIERMGPAAITFPNQREYARTAIQTFSTTATERIIYTHTGWREVDGLWIFLHGGGAICGGGAMPDVSVRLLGPMSHYELHLPEGLDKQRAVTASLQLLELAQPSISFPLLAATCRSVFGEADFAVHLAGETGSFKSELAALHQQHFGPAMHRLHLPGTWSSTGNSIEALAFDAKDTLLVVDDFAPQGSGVDVARYHAVADRVFRAAGNQAGRGRLDSNANLREPKFPRALILSTGEEVPRGQSVRARLLILELSKGDIKPSHLSECQIAAKIGLYAEALGGFVQWLAVDLPGARAVFVSKVAEYHAKALHDIAHARTPDIVANLQAGFEMYLQFGVACGSLNPAAAGRVAKRCWDALRDAAAMQSKHQGESEPVARFLAILRSLLTGRAHIAARSGGTPDNPGSCGWRLDSGRWSPFGDCIGWVEGDDIYLEPSAAYRQVQMAATAAGECIAVSEQMLRKRMRDKRWLASVDESRGTLTVRRMINGSTMSVLHLSKDLVLPTAGDGDVG